MLESTKVTSGRLAGSVTRPGPERTGRRVRAGPRLAGLLAALLAAALLTPCAVSGQREPAPIEQQVCADCHAVDSLRQSVHGTDVSCLACHSVDRHREMPQDSAVKARARSEVCAECHSDLQPAHAEVREAAPLCTDCHVAHAEPGVADAAPLMARRCGACHEAELSDFLAGAHADAIALDEPNPDLPSCQTCHPAHDAAFASVHGARLEGTALCIECHSDRLLIGSYDLPDFAAESYEADFHGETMESLWRHPAGDSAAFVLICADCHGAHQVEWLARDEVVGVCLNCHQSADRSIAGAWLGHDRIGPDNAVVIWLIRLFYYSFVPIVLVGLVFNIGLDLRYQRRGHPAAALHASDEAAKIGIMRFSALERTEHFLAMSTFILLVVTGLPQLWPQAMVSRTLIDLWGGLHAMRIIHRITGVIFVGLLVLHVTKALVRAVRQRRMPIMVATRKDFRDTLQTVRHFLGLAPAPKIGKFDFRAKFEYWGLFLGGTLMSATGLMLLFPNLVSWIVPGSVIAAGRVLHGLEGTFAVLVVLLWHSWSVILRPEVFPLDRSIFTGRIGLERLREEHAAEYERIFGADDDATKS